MKRRAMTGWLTGWLTRLAAVLIASAASAATRYVDFDAAPSGDGLTWKTAHRSLQDALAAAAQDAGAVEIRIAQGVYRPDDGAGQRLGDPFATFQLDERLSLMGAFAGPGTPDPFARDPELYETTLSGDLEGDDGPDFANRLDNSHHVVTVSAACAGARIDGVTIAAGYAHDSSEPGEPECDFAGTIDRGGGLLVNGGDVSVRATRFAGNRARRGGGGAALAPGAKAAFVDCAFEANRANIGGGLFARTADATVDRCIFFSNSADGEGGAVALELHATLMLRDCVLVENTSACQSGAVMVRRSSAVVSGCELRLNETFGLGGAIRLHDSATADSSLIVRRSRFVQNAAGAGGAIAAELDPNGLFVVRDSLFVGNFSDQVGGAIAMAGVSRRAAPDIANSTFALNIGCCNSQGIKNEHAGAIVRNCIFYLNTNFSTALGLAAYTSCASFPSALGGSSNLNVDPMFVDNIGPDGLIGSGDEDFHLLPGSPVIDAGDGSVVEPCELDFDGRERVVGAIDIGAFEFGATLRDDCDGNGFDDACQADCNGNGIPDACDILDGTSIDLDGDGVPGECCTESDVNSSGETGFDDLVILLTEWGRCPVLCTCTADVDGSGDVGFGDLTLLLLAWGRCP